MVSESLEMDTLPPDSVPAGQEHQLRRSLYDKDYLLGIGLLMLVVLLWTSSNFVTQVRNKYSWPSIFFTMHMLGPI